MSLNKSVFARLTSVAVGAFLSSFSANASAANWDTCWGSPVMWRGYIEVDQNSYSIPRGSLVENAARHAVDQWNQNSGVLGGWFVNPTTDHEISNGDGNNEVGLVLRSSIDGADGDAEIIVGPCFIGPNDIDEVDVLMASDLNFGYGSGANLGGGNYGRAVFVHEFGHFFGFNHDSGQSVMWGTGFEPVTGGAEPATTWPRDLRLME